MPGQAAERGHSGALASAATLSPAEAQDVAALFRLLGDPSRCRLVYALLDAGEICVGELAQTLGMTESNVSHHLGLLRAHGLVRYRRDGRQVFYAPDDEHIRELLDLTREHVRHRTEPL